MSLFPRFSGEFTPLFRLLDDYATHTAGRPGGLQASLSARSFTPRFDIKETKEGYELHGELPGVEQKDISIEFTDHNTIQISGRTESRRVRGNPPQGFIEGEQKQIEGNSKGYHKPTVEDEDGQQSSTEVQKSGSQEVSEHQQQSDGSRWWVTERSYGEFSRSFAFPSRVDQDKVKASLKNGILTVFVPKAAAPQPKKINIE
jgi:HSP20 family protein